MARTPGSGFVTEAMLEEALSGIGTSGSVRIISGAVDLTPADPECVEFYTVGSTTIEGVVFPADTAVVFARTSGGAWRYKVVEGWTLVPGGGTTVVTPTGPTWTDDTDEGGGVWSTPADAGVIYTPSGTDVAASPATTVTWNATAEAGYVLSGTKTWSHTFPARPAATLRSEILADAPDLYFPLDEAPGAPIQNLGSVAIGAVTINGTGITLGAPGLKPNSTAASFDGTAGQSMSVDYGHVRSGTAALTYEALVYSTIPADASGRAAWIFGTGNAIYDIQFNTYGNVRAFDAQLSYAWAKDTAYHLVVTFDGTTARAYKNGTQVATTARTNTTPSRGGIGRIGARDATAAQPWQGRLSDFASYDKVLTPERIYAHAVAAGYAT